MTFRTSVWIMSMKYPWIRNMVVINFISINDYITFFTHNSCFRSFNKMEYLHKKALKFFTKLWPTKIWYVHCRSIFQRYIDAARGLHSLSDGLYFMHVLQSWSCITRRTELQLPVPTILWKVTGSCAKLTLITDLMSSLLCSHVHSTYI